MKKTLSLLFVVASCMLSTMPAMAQFNLKRQLAEQQKLPKL